MHRFLFSLCLLLLLSCKHSPPVPAAFTGTAMTMEYRVLVGKELTLVEREWIHTLIAETFAEINEIYNKWNPDAEISRFNRHRERTPFPLSKDLYVFLKETDGIVHLTHGKFDPTIEPALNLWKNALSQHHEPTPEEIAKTKEMIGWEKIFLSDQTAAKEAPESQLDLGGIAKGFAINLIVERLVEQGFSDCYVEWGGEIRATGKHPEGRPWNVCISYMGIPDPSLALAIVDLNDEAVASSGDYLQYWKTADKTYTHIIDAATACPLEVNDGSICSATVIAPNCMLADALATAAMLFPDKHKAELWLESLKTDYPSLKYWILTRNEATKKPHAP